MRSAGLRQHFVRRDFGQTEKLAEETAFGEKFVFDDLSDRGGAWMWFEGDIVFGEFVPDGVELVHLTRIGLQQVLKNAIRSTGNFGVFDSNILVLHKSLR